MKFFKRIPGVLRTQRGLSILEILLATGLSGAFVYAGMHLVGISGGLQKTTEGQSIVDRELAAGIQLANNPGRIAPFLNLAGLGDCLVRDRNANCAPFGDGVWKDYPSATGKDGPRFQAQYGATGPCASPDPSKSCLVDRKMQFRWICTARACTGLETRVLVIPVNALENKIKPREAIIKLDRRQFMSRAQINFVCDEVTNRRSLTGVDYADLSDICKSYDISRCDLPHRTYQPAGAGDCREALDRACNTGFGLAGLDNDSSACAPPPGGRTLAGGSSGTSTATTTNTNTTTVTQTTPSPNPDPSTRPESNCGTGANPCPHTWQTNGETYETTLRLQEAMTRMSPEDRARWYCPHGGITSWNMPCTQYGYRCSRPSGGGMVLPFQVIWQCLPTPRSFQ